MMFPMYELRNAWGGNHRTGHWHQQQQQCASYVVIIHVFVSIKVTAC